MPALDSLSAPDPLARDAVVLFGRLGVFPGLTPTDEFHNRCPAVNTRYVPRERCLLDTGHTPRMHRDIDGGTWVDDTEDQ